MTDCLCNGPKCSLSADDPRHGSDNGYTTCGCRCDGCRSAATVVRVAQQARRRAAARAAVTRAEDASRALSVAKVKALRAPTPAMRRAMLDLLQPIEAALHADN